MEKGGRIRASGALGALMNDLSLPIARQPEASVILVVTVAHYDEIYDLTTCTLGRTAIVVPGQLGIQGSRRRLRLTASDVSLVKGEAPDTSILNVLSAKILSVERSRTNQMLVLLNLQGEDDGGRLIASITRKSWDHLGLQLGDEVLAQIKGMALAGAR
jgi:molybdate transport system ATP-binding protein